jgi:hypothetical protein
VLTPAVEFQNVPEPDLALAERLFEMLAKGSADTPGVAHGRGEQLAHELVAARSVYRSSLCRSLAAKTGSWHKAGRSCHNARHGPRS